MVRGLVVILNGTVVEAGPRAVLFSAHRIWTRRIALQWYAKAPGKAAGDEAMRFLPSWTRRESRMFQSLPGKCRDGDNKVSARNLEVWGRD
jgi:hypothetical protein